MTPGNRCAAAACPYHSSVQGVDGAPYCRIHARHLERRLDDWGAAAAQYEQLLAAPAWLPSELHAEWRTCRRNYIYADFSDETEAADSLAAIFRLRDLERRYG